MAESGLSRAIEQAVPEILSKNSIDPGAKYDLEVAPLQKSMEIRTKAYSVTLRTSEEEIPVFCKEFLDWHKHQDLNRRARDRVSDVVFLEAFSRCNGFAPMFYSNSFFLEDNVMHDFIFTKKYTMTMNDKVNKMRIKKAESEDSAEKRYIEDAIGDCIRRAIDIFYVNSALLEKNRLKEKESAQQIDENYLDYRISKYLTTIVRFAMQDDVEVTRWLVRYPLETAVSYMTRVLGAGESGKKVFHYEPRLEHILLDQEVVRPDSKAIVAVIDDGKDLLDACRQVLENEGYSVKTYDKAEKLIKSLKDGEIFDAVIADITLNGMSGAKLIEKIKQRMSGVPIIAMTGMGGITSIDGVLAYLLKPFQSKVLLDTVKGIIKKTSDSRADLYKPGSVLSLLESIRETEKNNYVLGESRGPYQGYALCDFNKMGYGRPHIGLAAMINDPLLVRAVSGKKLKELLEHAIVAQQRVDLGKDMTLKAIKEEGIEEKFENLYYSAARYNLLRALHHSFGLYAMRLARGDVTAEETADVFDYGKNAIARLIEVHDINPKKEYSQMDECIAQIKPDLERKQNILMERLASKI